MENNFVYRFSLTVGLWVRHYNASRLTSQVVNARS